MGQDSVTLPTLLSDATFYFALIRPSRIRTFSSLRTIAERNAMILRLGRDDLTKISLKDHMDYFLFSSWYHCW